MLVIFNGLIISGLLVISPPGRSRLIEPFVVGILQDEVGQKLIYKKFARPSAVELAQVAVPRTPWVQLLLCLFMDLVCGNASYLVPLLGDAAPTFAHGANKLTGNHKADCCSVSGAPGCECHRMLMQSARANFMPHP